MPQPNLSIIIVLQSRGLNAVEYLWDVIEQEPRRSPESQHGPESQIISSNISLESMPQRIKAVLRATGGPIQY